MPRMALVMVNLNLLLCMILCDKKELIINYEDYEEGYIDRFLFEEENLFEQMIQEMMDEDDREGEEIWNKISRKNTKKNTGRNKNAR